MGTRGNASAIGPGGETNEDINFGCSGNPLGQVAQFIPQDCFIFPSLWLLRLSEGGEKGFHAEVGSRSCRGGMLRASPFWECVGRGRSNVGLLHVVSGALEGCTALLWATLWADPEAAGGIR